MISNVTLFFFAIAKAALLTGLGPAFGIAIVLELRGVRVVAIGIENNPGRAVSRALSNGNKPAREEFARAA